MSKQVVIVGAGVVGCLIAKVLKKHDIPFKILEKNKEIRKDPRRTVALTSDSIKFLNSLEKELDLNAWATPVERMHLYQKSDLNLVLESKEEKKVTSICLLDDLHEKILSGLDSDILWDEDIKNIGLGPNIQIKTQENEFTADLLFATDGMNSNVRKLMHFDTEEWFYGQKAYVAVVRANHKNIAKQYFSKFGTLALLPLSKDKEYYSIILCTNSTSNADEQLKSLNEEFNLSLDLEGIELGSGFELKHVRAKKMFKDRILLSGDAANSFHPMAGQGLNLGIGDVMHIDRNIDQLIEMNSSTLEAYNSSRNQKNIQMTWIIQSLYGIFGNAEGLGEKIIESGMKFLDRIPSIKEKIIEFANKN